jgi:flagellar protein FliS
MTKEATLSYQQSAARGASPIGQIIALYDTILRDFGRALAALKAGDIEIRVFELNHALTVIGHLQCVLDHERGGEPAKHFERFYNITREMIVRANLVATPEALEELLNLYGGLRQAWLQAEKQLLQGNRSVPPIASSTSPNPPDNAKTNAANEADDDLEPSQLQWSA